jgi:hypothetical protein
LRARIILSGNTRRKGGAKENPAPAEQFFSLGRLERPFLCASCLKGLCPLSGVLRPHGDVSIIGLKIPEAATVRARRANVTKPSRSVIMCKAGVRVT